MCTHIFDGEERIELETKPETMQLELIALRV